tara:strand:+ start:1295 stop:2083 length:789 start_codon:yes stop_codon:yes gene_type:complete
MSVGIFVLTAWRFTYVLVLVVWSLMLASNQINNKKKWNEIFENTTVTADNWIHVGSAICLGCGIVVAAMSLYAIALDNGRMTNRSPKSSRLKRIIFDFACNMASMCIMSVASIYLYINRNLNKAATISGLSWAVTFGGMFLALAVLDGLFFRPNMTYLEFMSSPCVARVIKPMRVHDTTKEIHKAPHFMHRYLSGIIPLMPYLGTLGDGELEFAGMPVSSIVVGPDKKAVMQSEGDWYKEAARELVAFLEKKYELSNRRDVL